MRRGKRNWKIRESRRRIEMSSELISLFCGTFDCCSLIDVIDDGRSWKDPFVTLLEELTLLIFSFFNVEFVVSGHSVGLASNNKPFILFLGDFIFPKLLFHMSTDDIS